MDLDLTKRQKEIFDFIRKYAAKTGYPPTVREIGKAVGLHSSSTVHAHLANLEKIGLLRREVGCDQHMTGVRWLTVDTEDGRAQALAFWAEPIGLQDWIKLPLSEVAHILARACGHGGSGAAYLFHTVARLDELGIRDRNLWRLQQLVADEIKMLHATSTTAAVPLAR